MIEAKRISGDILATMRAAMELNDTPTIARQLMQHIAALEAELAAAKAESANLRDMSLDARHLLKRLPPTTTDVHYER